MDNVKRYIYISKRLFQDRYPDWSTTVQRLKGTSIRRFLNLPDNIVYYVLPNHNMKNQIFRPKKNDYPFQRKVFGNVL